MSVTEDETAIPHVENGRQKNFRPAFLMWIDGFMHVTDDDFKHNQQPRNKRMPLRDPHSENEMAWKEAYV